MMLRGRGRARVRVVRRRVVNKMGDFIVWEEIGIR